MKWQFKILTTLFLLIIFNEIIAQQNAYCTHFETERSTYKSAQACYDEIKISSVNQTVVVFEEDNPQFPFELEVSFKGQIDSIHISEFNRDRCRNNISRHRLYDNGQNLDKHQNDNIWTTEIPIRCYNFNTPYRIFSDNLRFKIEISYTENNESKIAEYFFKNQSYAVSQGFLSDVDTTEYHQLNDTIAYSNHIVNVLELTDLAYDYQKYNDRLLSVDLFRESWKSHSDDIVSLVSVNEINCNINNLASADIDRGVIRNSQLFSNTLNHELNHIWFNQNEVVLGFNEHHARYLERATSGFSKEGDCYNGFFNELSFENGKVFAKVIPNEQNTEGTDIINGYNTYFEFNDIELFLMGAVPIDSVQFPIRYIPWRQSLNCTSEIDEGLYQLEDQNSISTISRSEFERATANKRSYGTNSEIDVKFLLITKELISKRELLVLDYIVTLYEELFKRSTQGLGKLNTQIERIVDEDRDGYLSHVDCNDTRSDINPGQTEIAYNNIDDDCNPNTLDDDLDQDGYTLENDCDDLDAGINSGQAEIAYNNIDDDCNPNTLDDDLDQDGYTFENDCNDTRSDINPGQAEIAYNNIDDDCNPNTLDDDLDQDGYTFENDCDDLDASINSGQAEIAYNNIDDDCNPNTLDDDLDQDGYTFENDCDDLDASINSGQAEIAYNNIDDDCNPNTFDDDLDQDGYTFENDCDDLDASINSGQAEIVYNNIDDDCNPNTFDDDLDQDGYTLENDCDDLDPNINPGFEEIPDNTIDENCDGSIDNTTFINEVAGINFSIYPNPTSDILYIEFEHHINVNLKLYSPIQKSYLLHSAEGEINMKELQNGLYILILFDKDSKQVVTRKIVKN